MSLERKMDKCLENQTKMLVSIVQNTTDLSHHIKRTDMLEKKTDKLYYTIAMAIGGLAVHFGPSILTLFI